jgi:UDP-hydrolysing UDP-N-acetyl-D-glucosamine 2-epimerase
VITARASYARIKTALTAIDQHDHLELLLIVAASAVLDRYGSAIEVIEKDGFKITARVFNVIEGGDLLGQAKTTGLGIIELSNVISGLAPDVVVTIADRYETMATAISAAYLNIPLVHIQGGEVSGNIDEKVRHAITKLSDLHLVSTTEAQERVIKMGEVPERVIVTGCPSIDLAKEVAGNGQLDFDPYEKYGGVGAAPEVKDGYLIVMQHPVTTEYQAARKQIEETLSAVYRSRKTTLWFWPNVDAGSDGTSNGIRAFREKHVINFMHFFKNMEPLDFLKVLKNCACLIGNSSVGLREAAYLGVPSINIGTRQHRRSRATNVIDVDYDRTAIERALEDQLRHGAYPQSTLYGAGDAGKKIADLIASTEIQSAKFLTY